MSCLRSRPVLVCLFLLVSCSAYAHGDCVCRREPNTGLALAGGITFGAVYLAGIPATQALGRDGGATALMAIPFFGPFIVGADKPVTNAQGVALAAAAVAQGVGLTLLIVGLLTDHAVDAPSFAIGPAASGSGAVLTLPL